MRWARWRLAAALTAQGAGRRDFGKAFRRCAHREYAGNQSGRHLHYFMCAISLVMALVAEMWNRTERPGSGGNMPLCSSRIFC